MATVSLGERPSARGGSTVGLGVCPPPVLTDPEAPSPEVLWQICQVASGSPALHSGLQGHRSHAHAHMHTQPCQFMDLTEGTEALRKAAATAGPTMCHGVRDTQAGVHHLRHDSRGWG